MSSPYDFVVYVAPSTTEKKVPWIRVGVGFYHQDGEGISLSLQALPCDGGRLILRSYLDEQKKKEKFRASIQGGRAKSYGDGEEF